MKRIFNTPNKGSVRYIVFKEANDWYAVGLEFNIVISAENAQLALFELFEAMKGYVESFSKLHGVRMHALNQKADPEYEALWNELQKNKQPIKSPYTVYAYGAKTLTA
jgi:hypothetical protein